MEYIALIVLILALAASVFGIIAIIRPFKSLSLVKTRKAAAIFTLVCLIGAIISIIIIGESPVTQPPNQQAKLTTTKTPPPQTNPPTPAPSKVIEKDLGYNAQEFRMRFNGAAKEFGSDFEIPEISIEQGAVNDIFKTMIDERIGITATISKTNGNLKSALLLGTPDGTPQNAVKIMSGIGVMIAQSNPNLKPDERGNIMKSLGLFDKNTNLENYSKTTSSHGISYTVGSSSAVGIMFSISPSDK